MKKLIAALTISAIMSSVQACEIDQLYAESVAATLMKKPTTGMVVVAFGGAKASDTTVRGTLVVEMPSGDITRTIHDVEIKCKGE